MSAATPGFPTRVAVLGCGTMGRGIAFAFARAAIPCTVVDVDEAATRDGLARVLEDVRGATENGLISHPEAAVIERHLDSSWPIETAVAGRDLVVEAITEQFEAKRRAYERVERAVDERVVIVTNTSAIPITELAGFLEAPGRFLGTHWFNPAPWVPGLEVIPGPATDAEVVRRVVAAHRRLGKHPVVVPDRAGFVANRLQVALLAEAARLVQEEGIAAEDVDAIVRDSFGVRLAVYGPFAVADLGGLDVFAAIFATLEGELGERFRVPPALAELVQGGHLGAKSGRGFLPWPPERIAAESDRRDRALTALLAARGDATDGDT